MPVFYNRPVDPPPLPDTHITQQPQRKQLKRDYLGNIMGTRRSISPENGGVVPSTGEGRPISRGEIIERLKRSKQQNWPTDTIEQTTTESNLGSPTTQPTANIGTFQERGSEDVGSYAAGINIERPRSALHSGDFREQSHSTLYEQTSDSRTRTTPLKSQAQHAQATSFDQLSGVSTGQERSRLSFGARSYTDLFLPPTSPLIHASVNSDIENLDVPQTQSLTSRRRTFSPPSFTAPRSETDHASFDGRLSSHAPYRAHQPYRSISIPQAPRVRARGISSSSDASPLQHAPMVGSYEESILRGRMSATPSRPLDFIAQIGVLGRGKCKPSLRCPAHVTVPFPAVFYSHNGTGTSADTSPSPYVGLVDIEHSFPEYEGKSPAGGCYRIPQQGQLQIIIKNPNKTAVKLFLVPYDLSDMEPGTKTFIRQRSYSAGPIIDMPITSRNNFGTDRPEAAISHSEDPIDRPTLRYLVHLHICCTSRGRYFLYRSIRVVFANRVPDGKERLRNEVQLPEPRYAPYRLDSTNASGASSPFASSQCSRTIPSARRLSQPFAFAAYGMDRADGIGAGATSQGALPLSAAALQRKLHHPAHQVESQISSFSRALTFTEGSTTQSVVSLDVAPPTPTSPPTEPVLLESFDTWLDRRRRNGGSSDTG